MTGIVKVVSALLINSDQQVLIAQRPAHKPMAYFWEFPGGKVEKGEQKNEALSRELDEELGIIIDPLSAHEFMGYEYHYPTFIMHMTAFKCYQWSGEINLRENQGGYHWVDVKEMTKFSMPPGSLPIIEALLDQPDALKVGYTPHTCTEQYYPCVES